MHLRRLAMAAAAVAIAAPAYAADPVPPVTCASSVRTDDITLNPSYLDCRGPIDGNAPDAAITVAGWGTFEFVGKTEANGGGAGPFQSFGDEFKTGFLEFDTTQYGQFVIELKGGPNYSLYFFDAGLAGVDQIAFDTLGITTGSGKPGPGLSHASLYANPVPEPETYALMLGGLAAIGFIARRRRAA